MVASTFSNVEGNYVLFNLPAGSYDVRAYAAGWEFAAAQASVTADQQTSGIDLAGAGPAFGSVSGSGTITVGQVPLIRVTPWDGVIDSANASAVVNASSTPLIRWRNETGESVGTYSIEVFFGTPDFEPPVRGGWQHEGRTTLHFGRRIAVFAEWSFMLH